MTGCGTKAVLQLKLMYLTNTWLNIIIGSDAELLLSGFKYGFRLQYTGPRISVWSKNVVSVESHKAKTQIKLDMEIIMCRVLGPFF
jgi:hypothetical protein